MIELASEQADAYEWLTPAAHAQTPNAPQPDVSAAVNAFTTHLRNVVEGIRTSCCQAQVEMAAYQTGYLFHAIQDLATHAGMTNDYHSYLLTHGNPDLDAENLKRALDWSNEVLAAYRPSRFASCLKAASKLGGDGVKWDDLAKAAKYAPRDASTSSLLAFMSGGFRLSPPPASVWYDRRNPQEAKTWFKKNVMPVVQDSIGKACP